MAILVCIAKMLGDHPSIRTSTSSGLGRISPRKASTRLRAVTVSDSSPPMETTIRYAERRERSAYSVGNEARGDTYDVLHVPVTGPV